MHQCSHLCKTESVHSGAISTFIHWATCLVSRAYNGVQLVDMSNSCHNKSHLWQTQQCSRIPSGASWFSQSADSLQCIRPGTIEAWSVVDVLRWAAQQVALGMSPDGGVALIRFILELGNKTVQKNNKKSPTTKTNKRERISAACLLEPDQIELGLFSFSWCFIS